jgi:hypothetical protein
MGKTLINWQLNPQLIPHDPKKRFELYMMFMDMIKKDMEAGNLTGWGVYSDGSGGYAFTKLGSKELYAMILKWSPYVMFDAKPVLGVEETIEALKKAAE